MSDTFYKDIQNAPDYVVTKDGEVYHFYKTVGFKRMHPYTINGSYFVKINGEQVSVANIVLETFVGPRSDDSFKAYHLNDISIDNHLENLVWATTAEIRALTSVYPLYRRAALDAMRNDDKDALIKLRSEDE